MIYFIIFFISMSIGFTIGILLAYAWHKGGCLDCPAKDVYEFETGNKFQSY